MNDPIENKFRADFKAMDTDQNGFISHKELRQYMAKRGERLTDEEIDKMIRNCDIDGDGLINYEEYVTFVTAFGEFQAPKGFDS